MPLHNLASLLLILAFLTVAHVVTWVIPGFIAAVASALATAQAIPSLTRSDTFVIARLWFKGLAVGTFAGVAVYLLLGATTIALSVLGMRLSHATWLFLDVIFTAISIAAGGAFAGWSSARLLIPQLSVKYDLGSDVA